MDTVINILWISLLVALVCSFYIFYRNYATMKNKDFVNSTNVWQFPMVLALFLEAFFFM